MGSERAASLFFGPNFLETPPETDFGFRPNGCRAEPLSETSTPRGERPGGLRRLRAGGVDAGVRRSGGGPLLPRRGQLRCGCEGGVDVGGVGGMGDVSNLWGGGRGWGAGGNDNLLVGFQIQARKGLKGPKI